MDFVKLIVFFVLTATLHGCVSYQAKELRDDTVKAPLAATGSNALILEAKNHACTDPTIHIDLNRPLSPQEVSVIAVLVSPDLKALRAKEGVAKAQVFDAGLLPDPQIGFTYDVPLHQTSPPTIPFSTAFNLGLSWDIAGLYTRHAKVRVAKAQYQQIRYDTAWQEWLLANQAELLVMRSYFLEKQLQMMQQATHSAKNLLEVTKRNLEEHNEKIDNLALRQTAYLDLQDKTQTLERALKKTQLQLNRVLGLYPDEKIVVNTEPLAVPANLQIDNLFSDARTKRLDLVALASGYESQEGQLYQAVLGQYPRFTLGIARARDNGDVNTLGGILNFNIPLFNRNQGVIAIAHATREKLYLEYNSRLHQTRADIAELVADLKRIKQAEFLLEKELPEMRKADEIMRQAFKNGSVTQIIYENLHADLINKELKLLIMQQDAAEQMVALQVAVGSPMDGRKTLCQ